MSASHGRTSYGRSKSHKGAVSLFILAGIAVVAAGAFVVTSAGKVSLAGATGSSGSRSAKLVATRPLPSLSITSTTPAPGATNVAPNTGISVTFSAPLASGGPMPSLSPAVPGKWTQPSPNTLAFQPSASFAPYGTETIDIPGSTSGIKGTKGQILPANASVVFSIAPGSLLRAQQLLAQLGYLPLTFNPSNPAPVAPQNEAIAQPGTFSWKWASMQQYLQSMWTPGQTNMVTKGAVMAFEDQHNLSTDGIVGPQVWNALLAAVAKGQTDPKPYDYVYVSKQLPETMDLYSNGQVIITTPVNTGIPQSPTPNGTYAVYLRYPFQIMRGTNPNGSHYADPVHWISYFYQSDALHGFYRASYGWPQSLGCVEQPIPTAQKVYPYTPIGTLVTIAP